MRKKKKASEFTKLPDAPDPITLPKIRKTKQKRSVVEGIPHIEGDFQLGAFDISLNRPGFALLQYHADTRTVELLRKDYINNNRKPHKKRGEILNEIGKLFLDYISPLCVKVCVREASFNKFNRSTFNLCATIGALEMILWDRKEQWFQELAPKAIKKAVTGSGNAEKDKVAEALEAYIGPSTWRVDDESDACAVGIAWLILNGYIDPVPYNEDEPS